MRNTVKALLKSTNPPSEILLMFFFLFSPPLSKCFTSRFNLYQTKFEIFSNFVTVILLPSQIHFLRYSGLLSSNHLHHYIN